MATVGIINQLIRFENCLLPLRKIVIFATPAEILVGEAIDELEVIFAKRLNSAEQIAIWQSGITSPQPGSVKNRVFFLFSKQGKK